MTDSLAQTPLYDWHLQRSARMVDFAGWSMPVQYTSIVDEHLATRNAIGVFDISHMGRLRFDGPDAAAFLDRLLTRRVVGLKSGAVRYSLITNEAGGILDDVLIYHLQDEANHPFHLLVVNASNRPKIVAWIESHLTSEDDVSFRDQTTETAMIAVQGPRALDAVQPLVEPVLGDMKYYTGCVSKIGGQPGILSRTGYTGEDGCELIVPAESAVQVLDGVMQAGAAHGIKPAGLGARDTLRLEAAMPLYGHELSEEINPFQAGLGFAVQFKDREFVGCKALAKLKDLSNQPERIGLALDGKRVPREHYPVTLHGETIGAVTSGTFSPTLERPIAMAYVRPNTVAVGDPAAVDIRDRDHRAEVVELPFYRRDRKSG